MIYSELKTNNCQKCKLSREQILVSFHLVFRSYSDNFYRKQLPADLILNVLSSSWKAFILKASYIHMHIYISEFDIPLCCRYHVVLSSTCKEYSNDMQFLSTSVHYNPTNYTSCESLTNI